MTDLSGMTSFHLVPKHRWLLKCPTILFLPYVIPIVIENYQNHAYAFQTFWTIAQSVQHLSLGY